MPQPRAIIIAGPNGAGKTTFAKQFLPAEGACRTFINADLIAAGLSPFRPEDAAIQAMRLMAETMHAKAQKREDFAIETTLAGRSYLGLIREWQQRGYETCIIFLSLPSVEIAIERVRLRVLQGGHDIPQEIIRRRFTQGLYHFHQDYKNLVDQWFFYDASKHPSVFLEESP